MIYLKAFSSDVYLSSANAISEDGVIVNIDGNGNRVAAITWGPKKVIFVIGMNKVAQNVEAALARARSTAAPTNAARFDVTAKQIQRDTQFPQDLEAARALGQRLVEQATPK